MNWSTTFPLIAILRGIHPEEAVPHTQALLDAGLELVEVPLNSPKWYASIQTLVAQFGEQALIGGGTVLRIEEVDALADLGARFIVTPNTRPSLIAHAVKRGLQVVCGFATASEAFDALDAGAQALKLFPASTYGPDHVRALRAVLPTNVPLFAVGGINLTNLADFMRAGCVGVGLGGDLYKPGQDVARTVSVGRAFVNAYQEATRA